MGIDSRFYALTDLPVRARGPVYALTPLGGTCGPPSRKEDQDEIGLPQPTSHDWLDSGVDWSATKARTNTLREAHELPSGPFGHNPIAEINPCGKRRSPINEVIGGSNRD
jgi:hypothetical protein